MSSIICGVYGKILGNSSHDDENEDDEEREDTGLVFSPPASESKDKTIKTPASDGTTREDTGLFPSSSKSKDKTIETPSSGGTTKRRWWVPARHRNSKGSNRIISNSPNESPTSSTKKKKAGDWKVASRHAKDTNQALFLVRSPKSRTECTRLRKSGESASVSSEEGKSGFPHLALLDHRTDSMVSSISSAKSWSSTYNSVESWVWDDGNESFFYDDDEEEEAFVPNGSTAMMIF